MYGGITSNEWVDEEAKKAAQGNSSEQLHLPPVCREGLPGNRSVACQGHTRKLKDRVAVLFKILPRCQCI